MRDREKCTAEWMGERTKGMRREGEKEEEEGDVFIHKSTQRTGVGDAAQVKNGF